MGEHVRCVSTALPFSQQNCEWKLSWSWSIISRGRLTNYLGAQYLTGPPARPKRAVTHRCAHWLCVHKGGETCLAMERFDYGPDITEGIPDRWSNTKERREESMGQALA